MTTRIWVRSDGAFNDPQIAAQTMALSIPNTPGFEPWNQHLGPTWINHNTEDLFNLARTLTLTNVVVGSNVRLYTDDGDDSDGFGALVDNEASAASSTVTLNYTFTGAVVTAILVIIQPTYQYYRVDGISLGSTNQSIPIAQVTDFAYSDP